MRVKNEVLKVWSARTALHVELTVLSSTQLQSTRSCLYQESSSLWSLQKTFSLAVLWLCLLHSSSSRMEIMRWYESTTSVPDKHGDVVYLPKALTPSHNINMIIKSSCLRPNSPNTRALHVGYTLIPVWLEEARAVYRFTSRARPLPIRTPVTPLVLLAGVACDHVVGKESW